LLADVLFRVQKPIDRELSGIQLRIVPLFGHFRSPLCFTKTASSRPAGFSWSFDQPYHPASLYPIKRMNDVAHG
jgi:hypothetical protein